MKKTWLSWSSGKDCAWALHVLRQRGEVEVVGLITTFNQSANRVAMHAVRRVLVEEQARLAGLPLHAFDLPWPCSNTEYQEIMAGAYKLAISEGVECVAFGDLFLEDVRAYREEQLKHTGLQPLFPIWGIPTAELARQMHDAGLRATITCVDPRLLDSSFAGREWNDAKESFPEMVDVCGEKGEFHTFAHAGPMFSSAILVRTGDIVERDGFVFADVIGLSIRRASPEDANSVAELCTQLGYPASDSEISARLHSYQRDPLHNILIADFGDSVIGWVDANIASHLVSGSRGEIAGLVVANGFRGRGIGARLLTAAEEWIVDQGVTKCVVRSRSTRLDAHRFYKRENYTLEKTSAVFCKTLKSP